VRWEENLQTNNVKLVAIAESEKKHSKEIKDKLSAQKKGMLNPNYGKVPWNKGIFGPESPTFGIKHSESSIKRGKDNPMYGKSPSCKAGHGIWGKFNGNHFRSSLELFYLMYWLEKGVAVESAEQNFFRIRYPDNEGWHTYTPDFFLIYENTLVELKPEKMQENDIVVKKIETLKAVFDKMICKIMGFRDIGPYILDVIANEKIDSYIGYELIMEDSQLLRLKKNYGDIVRATKG
jgi:hypothetical protein